MTLLDIAQVASQLTDRHQHIEPVWVRDRHRNRRMRHVWVSTQDGLLQQLADAVFTPGNPDDNGGGRPIPGSRPPGAFEAMARHAAITAEVTRWCWDLRLTIRNTVEDNIRALVGKAPELDPNQTAALLADLHRWHGQAAAMTGWASHNFAPRATCPIVDCGRSNTLRVNLDRSVATCMACGSLWDDTDGSFAALARHVEHATTAPTNGRVRIRSGKQGNGGWVADQPAYPTSTAARADVLTELAALANEVETRRVKVGRAKIGTGILEPVSYNTVHQRLRRSRGAASDQTCPCGNPAEDWAYDHSDPDELVSTRGMRYSLDLTRYRALCRICHRADDQRP